LASLPDRCRDGRSFQPPAGATDAAGAARKKDEAAGAAGKKDEAAGAAGKKDEAAGAARKKDEAAGAARKKDEAAGAAGKKELAEAVIAGAMRRASAPFAAGVHRPRSSRAVKAAVRRFD